LLVNKKKRYCQHFHIIEYKNRITQWKYTEPPQKPLYIPQIPILTPQEIYSIPKLPSHQSERLENILPKELSNLPELKDVWINIKAVLWTWEKISRCNWEYHDRRQLTLSKEKRIFLNPDQFYLLLLLPRLTPILPADIALEIRKHLPPIYYITTLFCKIEKTSNRSSTLTKKHTFTLKPPNKAELTFEKIESTPSHTNIIKTIHTGKYRTRNNILNFTIKSFKSSSVTYNRSELSDSVESSVSEYLSFKFKMVPSPHGLILQTLKEKKKDIPYGLFKIEFLKPDYLLECGRDDVS